MKLNGQRIQDARKAQALTRAQLSRDLEVDVKTIYNAERGRNVNSVTLARIAARLDLNLDSLFDAPTEKEAVA